MKKYIVLILAAVMVLSLAACGGKTGGGSTPQQEQGSNTAEDDSASAPAENDAPAPQAPAQPSASDRIAPAEDGTLTLSRADIAVVVNGTTVPMPYKLRELEAAGVPSDASRSDIELSAGDFFSANLYLDDNEDYLLIPAYYNDGDSSVGIAEAEAEEIMMTTYSDEPEDQGVSILGVFFGMPRSEVKDLLGGPSYDEGDYLEWHIEVPDISYEGTLSMYFTEDADSAGVSQVDLSVFPK